MQVPTSICCAYCGKSLHTLTSFGLSVPVNSPLQSADFCDLLCLAAWAMAQTNPA